MNRDLFHWNVVITDAEDGKTKEIKAQSYWSPEREGTVDEIARATAATESVRTKRKHLPISATLVA